MALADTGRCPTTRRWPTGRTCRRYYAAIRSEGSGRVVAVPGLRSPLVTYSLTEGDLSRLARGLVHLGELLLAAGATELYPSVVGGPIVRRVDELGAWWDQSPGPGPTS